MTKPANAVNTGRSSALIGAGILLSRVLGLLRQTLIARYLGAGAASDVFNGAFRITNFLQNLFGEGALSASFIPVYAQALEKGDDREADRIAGAVAAILAMATAVIVLLGILAAPLVTEAIVGGFAGPKFDLTVRLTRIFFPGAGIFVMSAWCLGILNSHRRFFLAYAAPVFWNIAMIAALLFYGPRRGEVDLAVALAWASVIGAALQMGVQLPSVFRLVRHPRFVPDFSLAPVREVVKNFLPAFVSRGVVQLSAFVDLRLASGIAFEGSVALLSYAQTIYVLPISLFGMAISAAELPEMAREGGTDAAAYARLRTRLEAAIPRVAFFCVPSALAFLFIGDAIAGVLLQHGRFSPADSIHTWAILGGSAFGLVASALARLYSSTFYALRDTRTPLWFAVTRVVLTGVLGYLFAYPLPAMLGLPAWTGVAGLTASAGIAGWVEFYLLRRAIGRRIGHTGMPLGQLARLWGAGILAGLCSLAETRTLHSEHAFLVGLLAMGTFTLVYGATTVALGVPQAIRISSRLLRRS
ncbi:MAG: integral rane protein MviN [Gemmatimonadetes bacterium]|nr:integral rane protein MviN [Gemmatimonadota bacterium]